MSFSHLHSFFFPLFHFFHHSFPFLPTSLSSHFPSPRSLFPFPPTFTPSPSSFNIDGKFFFLTNTSLFPIVFPYRMFFSSLFFWLCKNNKRKKVGITKIRMFRWMCGHIRKDMIWNDYIQGDLVCHCSMRSGLMGTFFVSI